MRGNKGKQIFSLIRNMKKNRQSSCNMNKIYTHGHIYTISSRVFRSTSFFFYKWIIIKIRDLQGNRISLHFDNFSNSNFLKLVIKVLIKIWNSYLKVVIFFFGNFKIDSIYYIEKKRKKVENCCITSFQLAIS